MKIRLFALPVAVILLYQLAAGAAHESAPSSSGKASAQGSPTLKFLRPIKGEHFYDYPIFLSVEVTGFHLVPLGTQRSNTTPPNTGHINFSMDDYPVYETDDTQIMIGKFLGDRYLPVGWHVLKAQLVDVNDQPLNPPVEAISSVFSGHSALVETDHAEKGSRQSELVAEELFKMRSHLEEMKRELHKIETGSYGFVPTPAGNTQHGAE